MRNPHPIKCEVSGAPGWRSRARVRTGGSGESQLPVLAGVLPEVLGRSLPFRASHSPGGKIVCYLTFKKQTLIFSRSAERWISTEIYREVLILCRTWYWLWLWYLQQQELCSFKWIFLPRIKLSRCSTDLLGQSTFLGVLQKVAPLPCHITTHPFQQSHSFPGRWKTVLGIFRPGLC